MRFVLEIDTGNDAFQDGRLGVELSRLLAEAAARIEHDHYIGATGFAGILYDLNGNRVGHYETGRTRARRK